MKKQKIILTKGLPASGKSSWAKEFVAKANGKAKRINKDDLRAMLDNSVYSKPNEDFVVKARDLLVHAALVNKYETIIIDDTNFEHKHFERMEEIARIVAAGNLNNGMQTSVEYKEFLDVTLDECVERDSKRPKPVGEKVIKGMYQKYIIPTIPRNIGANRKGDTIVVDVDGTIANNDGHRGWYDLTKVHNDQPIIPIINIVQMYKSNGYRVIVVSAREGTAECRRLTEEWMKQHEVPYDLFLMRSEKDMRKDSIVKEEIYRAHLEGKYDIEVVLDDRNDVVDLWRSLGLRCIQVAPGNF